MLLDSRSRRYGVSGGADGGPGASPAGEGRRKWGHHHLLLIASHTPSAGMREYSKGKRGQLNMFRLPDSCVLWLSLTVSPRICQPSRLRGNSSILVCAATTVRQRLTHSGGICAHISCHEATALSGPSSFTCMWWTNRWRARAHASHACSSDWLRAKAFDTGPSVCVCVFVHWRFRETEAWRASELHFKWGCRLLCDSAHFTFVLHGKPECESIL